MTLFWFGLLVAATIWVAIDAGKRDWSNDKFAKSQTTWIVGMVLLAVIVFPIYLFRRGRAPLKGSVVRAGSIGTPTASLSAGAPTSYATPSGTYGAAPPPPPPPPNTGPPAGWYSDPRQEKRLRYWDGAGWTEHVAD
jgi:Protein of unknown function (DUF2510)